MYRYDKKLRLEVNKTIRNYNAKITRLGKAGKDNVYIPKKIGRDAKKELLTSVSTRKDLRKRLRDLKYYTEKGGEKYIERHEKGYKISEQGKVPLSIYKSYMNYRRSLAFKLKKDYDRIYYGESTYLGKKNILTHAQALDEQYYQYKTLLDLYETNIFNLSPKQIDKVMRHYKSATKSRDKGGFREAFIEMLVDTAYVNGVPHEKLHFIIEKLRSLTEDEFYNIFKQEKSLQAIISYYATTNRFGVDVSYEMTHSQASALFDELISNIEDIIDVDYKEIESNKRLEEDAIKFVRQKYPDMDINSRMFKTLVFNKRNQLRNERNK